MVIFQILRIFNYIYRLNSSSDFEKFKEELGSKWSFHSSSTDGKINNKEYEHVLNVWKKFKVKTMKDYHGLYLKCDVLLLVDVFKLECNA